jgi:FKBP-type peptidyl-prolyl cis-trans isomerase FkpA
MTRALFVLILAAALAASACGGDSSSSSTPTSPTAQPSAPYSQTDLRVGTGTEVTSGRSVAVNYTGWLYNPSGTDGKGQQFDSNAGRAPFTFVVGSNQVIPGFSQGVTGMRVGGLRRVVLPPALAYGSTGNGPIPPNATLVFEIEVVAVQ